MATDMHHGFAALSIVVFALTTLLKAAERTVALGDSLTFAYEAEFDC